MKKFFILLLFSISAFCFAQKEEPFSFVSFSVMAREKAVVLTWTASKQNSNLIIYRSTHSFSSFHSLSKAMPIANIVDTGRPFLDYPVPGIPFYYAIAEENQIASGKITFIDGKNTTSLPIEILIDESTILTQKKANTIRPIPLPYLNPEKKLEKKETFFSSQTENLINAITAKKYNYSEFKISSLRRKSYIFPDDKLRPKGGETMELKRILNEYFVSNQWEKCEKELEDFLKVKRTTRVTARTKFYQGEVLFFQNKYESALLKFLIAEDMYPNQAKEWIQYCLLELARTK